MVEPYLAESRDERNPLGIGVPVRHGAARPRPAADVPWAGVQDDGQEPPPDSR